MSDIDTLIKALRCSSMPYSDKTMDCADCPYRLLSEVDEKLPIPYDVEIDGKQYYESCDCDRMVVDAADMLEQLKAGDDNSNG